MLVAALHLREKLGSFRLLATSDIGSKNLVWPDPTDNRSPGC